MFLDSFVAFDLVIDKMATNVKAITLLVLTMRPSASVASESDLTAAVESRYTKLGCTSVVIGPKATVDGSVIATHNADCLNCDFRIARTPAMTHAAGELKSVLKYKVCNARVMSLLYYRFAEVKTGAYTN